LGFQGEQNAFFDVITAYRRPATIAITGFLEKFCIDTPTKRSQHLDWRENEYPSRFWAGGLGYFFFRRGN
jgi:hypothetical protein